MVTELGLKTTLEITEMEINKLLFDLGREYVEKNVTPLCISLCELLAEKTGVYFICGEAGKVENDLPEYLVVCPQYGSDCTQAYVKQGKLTSPGW